MNRLSRFPTSRLRTRWAGLLFACWCLAVPSLVADTNRVHRALPAVRPEGGYVSSRACVECHRDEHASWHRSYHRTMSKPAVPGNVQGDFSGATIRNNGLDFRVFKKGEEFWAEMPDPDELMYIVQGGKKLALDKVPRIERQVVMTTGSHHYETYWVESPRYPKLLQTLPLVYLLEDRRWAPRDAVFMKGPNDRERMVTQWNHHCIRCHSTGGNPGLDDKGRLQSSVAEFGIACEACHGPGESHVAFQRASKTPGASPAGPDPIVNPRKLTAAKSSEVCGQCHGVYIMRDEFAMEYARHGEMFRPGGDLHRFRYYIQYPGTNAPPDRRDDLRRNPQFFRERWWDDGTILAGGREYTAISASACYRSGQLSCLSCHSMHNSDPVDQLKRSGDRNDACTQCHKDARFTTEVARHTHHAAGSSGSECMNCHMPFTTYALLGAIRSHQISSPDPLNSARTGTPNACNLCHLDKTLAWTAQSLVRDFGKPVASLGPEHGQTSAALGWLLKGNAAQRAIAAWHFGWGPARQASGETWMAPFVAELLQDDYGVVRYVAGSSLKKIGGTGRLDFDFLAGPEERDRARRSVQDRWHSSAPPGLTLGPLLIEAGRVRSEEVARLLRDQDKRPVTIKE